MKKKVLITLTPGDWQSSEQHRPERKYNNHLENVFLKHISRQDLSLHCNTSVSKTSGQRKAKEAMSGLSYLAFILSLTQGILLKGNYQHS